MNDIPKRNRVQRVAVWLYALFAAVLTTLVIFQVKPQIHPFSLAVVFGILFFAFLCAWRWLFFERIAELDRKIPISSKELRKRKKEFFDSLRDD